MAKLFFIMAKTLAKLFVNALSLIKLNVDYGSKWDKTIYTVLWLHHETKQCTLFYDCTMRQNNVHCSMTAPWDKPMYTVLWLHQYCLDLFKTRTINEESIISEECK